jgi:hypothetical protein
MRAMAVEQNSVDSLLKRVDDFFMATSQVHKTMRALARRLSHEGIDYAFAGGMALVVHGYRRETVDVDVLLSIEGRELFSQNLVGRGYAPLFPGARKGFRDTETGVKSTSSHRASSREMANQSRSPFRTRPAPQSKLTGLE